MFTIKGYILLYMVYVRHVMAIPTPSIEFFVSKQVKSNLGDNKQVLRQSLSRPIDVAFPSNAMNITKKNTT